MAFTFISFIKFLSFPYFNFFLYILLWSIPIQRYQWQIIELLLTVWSPAASPFIYFVLSFFLLISCLAVSSFTVVRLLPKNSCERHSTSASYSTAIKVKSQTFGTHVMRQGRSLKNRSALPFEYVAKFQQVLVASSGEIGLPEAFLDQRDQLIPECCMPLSCIFCL